MRKIIQTETTEIILHDINLRLLRANSIIQLNITKHNKFGISSFILQKHSIFNIFQKKCFAICSLSLFIAMAFSKRGTIELAQRHILYTIQHNILQYI
jgi:hypothetical protein